MNKGGFSWKRLSGISAAKSNISKKIGVPLTKSGRQQKLGKMVSGGGCLLTIIMILVVGLLMFAIVFSSLAMAPPPTP